MDRQVNEAWGIGNIVVQHHAKIQFVNEDLYLWGEGRHEQLWDVLGAHFRPHEDVVGTGFSVWAPHARAARVVGDFNGWDGTQHAMRRLDDNGVWELFVPGLTPGTAYKFELLTAGEWVKRADPMARFTEVPPATASASTASSAWPIGIR